MKIRLLLALAILGWSGSAAHADQEALRQHLLVVYNQTNPDSERLARYYAVRREIPAERVFGLTCPDQEVVTREIYKKQIQEPIDNYLLQHGWMRRKPGVFATGRITFPVFSAEMNEIWVIVLVRGIPLKIDHDSTIMEDPALPPQFKTNAAAVDSELATLPTLGLPINGIVPNPYYLGYDREFDQFDAVRMILVARLDAPTPEIVQRMINDAVEVEPQRLAGRAYVDARGLTVDNRAYYGGDRWFYKANELLRREGWPVDFDEKPEIYPATQPWSEVALYLGWYAGDAAGPMLRPGTFRPGTVAYHLHSFSANTLRSLTGGWTGPLLAAGATASMGNVFEPYLELTPHVDVFAERLLQGYTFGEAAYSSMRALSWMATMVGDPLYQPFKAALQPGASEAGAVLGMKGEWQSIQSVQRELRNGAVKDPAIVLEKFAANTLPGLASLETAGDYLLEIHAEAEALQQWELAQFQARAAVDVVRIGQKRAVLLAKQNKFKDAYAVLKEVSVRVPQDLNTYGFGEFVRMIGSMPGAPALPPRLIVLAYPSRK